MAERETRTIDRLFLELSQFTKARTRREMVLAGALEEIADSAKRPWVEPGEHAAWSIGRAVRGLHDAEQDE